MNREIIFNHDGQGILNNRVKTDTTARTAARPSEERGPLRELLRRMLGIPTSDCALAAQKRGELDRGEVVIEKWLYTAETGSRIPANLYRPRTVAERIPAIVITCGHGDSKSVAHMQVVAQTYARAGVACLLADPLGEEERHPLGGIGTREHDEQWVVEATQRVGRPVMGKLVFDAMRALDFLESLDWIDSPECLAVLDPAEIGAPDFTTRGWLDRSSA